MMVFCAGVFFIACSAYFQAKGFFSLYFLFNGGLGASVHWCEGVFIGDAFLHFSSSLYPRSCTNFSLQSAFYFAICHLRGCLEKKHVLSIEGGLVGYHN